jgi:two-component system, LytTR family, response regulator LytT
VKKLPINIYIYRQFFNVRNFFGGMRHMFRIAICDDEKYFCESIRDYIFHYLKRAAILCEVDTFCSGKEFIELGIEMVRYNVVFLDINMKEMDGILTAKKIRDISKEMFIVFVTAYVNYTLEGYKVDAIRYLLKDNANFENTLSECMEAIIDKMNYRVVKKNFDFMEGTRELFLERILYIESRLHKLEFHVMEHEMKVYTMYNRLNELEKSLAKYGFIRIHQSYLVNIKYIKGIAGYKAILNNGVELIVPKARYKSVRDMFISYRGEI